MNYKVLSIEERSLTNQNGTQSPFQVLYVALDSGGVVPIWSNKTRHIYKIGDMVEIGLGARNGKPHVTIIYPTQQNNSR